MSATRLLLILAAGAAFAQTARHPLRLDDLARLREVRDPQCSPDGQWVAYTVSHHRREGRQARYRRLDDQLRRQDRLPGHLQPESESAPRWSPDGKYLSFTSSRPGKAKGNQVWLLDRARRRGDAVDRREGPVAGLRMVARFASVCAGDRRSRSRCRPASSRRSAAGARRRGSRGRAPKPIVIDRYKFKQDVPGYLLTGRHSYIYLFDIATKKLDRLTTQEAIRRSRRRLVARWHKDRLHQQSRCRSRSRSRGAGLRRRSASRAPRKSSSLRTTACAPAAAARNGVPTENGSPSWWATRRNTTLTAWSAWPWCPRDGSAAPALVKAAADLDRGVSAPRLSADRHPLPCW